MGNLGSTQAFPVETSFMLPSPLPSWPQGSVPYFSSIVFGPKNLSLVLNYDVVD